MPAYVAIPQQNGEFPKSELNGILQGVSVVLESWANLSSRYIGVPVEGPAPLPLEFSVKFSGQASGYLNVRTSDEMAKVLHRSIQSKNGSFITEEAIFKEFVAVFSGRLMAYLWGNNWGLFKSDAPVFSTPENWPASAPSACCAFIVENWPVEIRLWIESDTE
jgi:hypothetical protein